MTRPNSLSAILHGTPLWQILAVYLGAAYGILEAIDLFQQRFALPNWLFLTAFVILFAGFVGVATTALVQRAGRPAPAEAPAPSAGAELKTLRRLFTWRNALITAGAVWALWGVVVTGWLIFSTQGAATGTNLAADPALDPNRIAVLYFDDHSEGGVNAHLADAFAEGLTHELAMVPGLEALPRSFLKPFRGSDGTPPDSIARTLGAGTLVEGSVLGIGDSLQVTVQAFDANTMRHLTSIVVVGRRAAPLGVFRDLLRTIADSLRIQLGVEVRLRESMAGTESNEAWELVHLAAQQSDIGSELSDQGDSEGAERYFAMADSLLTLAETLDHEWVEPIVARGWVERRRAIDRATAPRMYDAESAERAIGHANRALELAPADASALELRGLAYNYLAATADDATKLNELAERDLRAAVAGDTTRALAYSRLSDLLWNRGRFVEAKFFATRALRADPYLERARAILNRLCQISIDLQEFGDAYRYCDEGRRRYPTRASFLSAELMLRTSVAQEPDPDSIWATADALLEALSDRDRVILEPEILMAVAAGLARAELADSARAVMRQARSLENGDGVSVDYREAYIRLLLGEEEETLRLLARYLEAEPGDREYIANEWWWEPLHGDPQFQELIRAPE